MPIPNLLRIAVAAASSDGRFYGRYPNGDKPISNIDLAANAAAEVASVSDITAQIRPAGTAAATATGSGNLSAQIQLMSDASALASATGYPNLNPPAKPTSFTWSDNGNGTFNASWVFESGGDAHTSLAIQIWNPNVSAWVQLVDLVGNISATSATNQTIPGTSGAVRNGAGEFGLRVVPSNAAGSTASDDLFKVVVTVLQGGAAATSTASADLVGSRLIQVSTIEALTSAVSSAIAGDIIEIIAAGDYPLISTLAPAAGNVIIRGAANLSSDSIQLIGRGMDNASHGGQTNGFYHAYPNITVRNLTVRDVYWHGATFAEGAHTPTFDRVIFLNCGQQFLKVSRFNTGPINDGTVRNCFFGYTNGRPTTMHDGQGPFYGGGADVHFASGWKIQNCVFQGFAPTAAEIAAASAAYPGVAQYWWSPAIYFWNESTAPLVEGCTFIDCGRAAAFGLEQRTGGLHDCYGGIMRNNIAVITPGRLGAAQIADADGQFLLWDCPNGRVINNTVLTNGQMTDAIQVRWAAAEVANNLCDDTIGLRDGGTNSGGSNTTNAQASWFASPNTGDPHLNGVGAAAVGTAARNANCLLDFDGFARDNPTRIGAAVNAAAVTLQATAAAQATGSGILSGGVQPRYTFQTPTAGKIGGTPTFTGAYVFPNTAPNTGADQVYGMQYVGVYHHIGPGSSSDRVVTTGHDTGTSGVPYIAEYIKPAIVNSTNPANWNVASLVQTFRSVDADFTNEPLAPLIAGLFYDKVSHPLNPGLTGTGKTLAGVVAYYDGGNGANNIVIYVNGANLAGTRQGPVQLTGAAQSGGGAHVIPTEYVAQFGGNTHFIGAGIGLSIVSRASNGPSAWAFKTADLAGSPTTVTAKAALNYPYGTTTMLARFDATDLSTPSKQMVTGKVWNAIAQAGKGQVIPGTRTVMFIGFNWNPYLAQTNNVLYYKDDDTPSGHGKDDTGTEQFGFFPYRHQAWYGAYYWLYDLDELVLAYNDPAGHPPSNIPPYEHGPLPGTWPVIDWQHKVTDWYFDYETKEFWMSVMYASAGKSGWAFTSSPAMFRGNLAGIA